MIEALPPLQPPPAIHVQCQEFSSDFVKYMQIVENSIHAGFNKQRKLWFPYKDVAGWHIAYGHKLSRKDLVNFRNGISQKDAERLLVQDLHIAKVRVHNYIIKTYKVNILLSEKQKEMLVDFSFNLGGLEEFPKFTEAVVRNNYNIIKKEYIRSSNGRKLDDRNEKFFKRFLS